MSLFDKVIQEELASWHIPPTKNISDLEREGKIIYEKKWPWKQGELTVIYCLDTNGLNIKKIGYVWENKKYFVVPKITVEDEVTFLTKTQRGILHHNKPHITYRHEGAVIYQRELANERITKIVYE